MATYTSNYGWTKPSGSDNVDISVLNNNLDGQDGVIHDAFLNMAPPFSESSTYAVDDIVLYTTGLYKCHTPVITPGSWTGSTNWQVYKLSEGGSGGGGTSNYNDLTNKPSINGVSLSGNKTTSDLGITASGVGAIPSTDKGANGGVATLGNDGIVPSSQLPSMFDGDYNSLTNKPTLGTAAAKDVPSAGNASLTEVVMGSDSRLSDDRNAKDVYPWAKTATKPTYTATEVGAIPSTDKGANGGVAELDSNGLVPASQLPSYVDDVLEGTAQNVTETSAGTYSATGFILSGESSPCAPESGKTYVDTTSNIQYRWTGTGTNFVSMGSNLALGETSSTAYRGDRGKTAYDHSQTTGNPHGTTKSDVGLGNVPNVSTNDQTPTFTEASTRNNIASGEKLSVILGKVQKFFNDLKTVAFSGSYTDLSNQPQINSNTLSGNKTASDLGLQDELTFDNTPTDGSNNPVKSDGIYDSEKDIYAVMGKMGAKNLIPYPYKETTKTENGITFTDNGDGTITANGTATDDAIIVLYQSSVSLLKAGRYILSGCPEGGGTNIYKIQAAKNNWTFGGADFGAGVVLDITNESTQQIQYIRILVSSGKTVSNLTFKPMLRLASDTDNTYQPYAKTNKELTESYPADRVMMSDGVTSVEDALDYSTTEHKVGKWIDGSDLYEKTIDFGALSNNTIKNVAHNISSLGRIVSLQGYAVESNTYYYPLPYISATALGNGIGLYATTTNVVIQTTIDRSGLYGYVTLRYTKNS